MIPVFDSFGSFAYSAKIVRFTMRSLNCDFELKDPLFKSLGLSEKNLSRGFFTTQ